jgi:hypothetical protein
MRIKVIPNFTDWVIVRDPNPEDMNSDGEDNYWFVSPKEYWDKHGSCSDKAEYIDIPNFDEAMEHCYICNQDWTMEQQEQYLVSLGFEIGDIDHWYYGYEYE